VINLSLSIYIFFMNQIGAKWRFQNRLWEVLFSNVNRSIDELYYLCEEEGDEEVSVKVLIKVTYSNSYRILGLTTCRIRLISLE
jgi:hypothetical protein